MDAPYAGFGRRAAAFLIDAVIVTAGGLPVLYTVGQAYISTFGSGQNAEQGLALALFVTGVLTAWLYSAGFESLARGATLGKMALGIAVRHANGGEIGFWRCSARFAGKVISIAILGIGFLLAAFTKKKQALQDIMAQTVVIRGR